jgi:hypothetical protein
VTAPCRAAAVALALLVTACGPGGVAPPDAALQDRPPTGAAWEEPDASTTFARELERRSGDPQPPGRPASVDASAAGPWLPRRGAPTPVAAARPGWPPEPSTDGVPLLLPAPKLALAWSADGGPDPLRLPIAAAVDRHGDVYVVDAGDGRIRVFHRDGRAARGWGGAGGGAGQFRFAAPRCASSGGTDRCATELGGGVAVDEQDRVYLADFGNHRVQVFDAAGRLLAAWGRAGDGPGEFRLPAGVAADGRGRVYVSDGGNARVQVFDRDGRFLGAWGGPGTGAGRFRRPGALAVDGAGRVAVADRWDDRIQVFDRDGRFLEAWRVTGSGRPGDFDDLLASGLGFEGRGDLIVAGAGAQVQQLDRAGRALRAWRADWRGQGRLVRPAGVAVDELGDVYVADAGAGRVAKFRVLTPVTR